MRNATILTGFLGSGKTTLLNQILNHPGFPASAVLVNEFGQVGIDNALLRFSTESVAVLANGCICCAVREDIEEAVRLLLDQEKKGEVPPFEHLFVETSGLADPAKLIQTFSSSPVLRSSFALSGVLATVDSTLGAKTLNRFPEAARQVALADTIALTKTDLLEEGTTVDPLLRQIKSANPDVRTTVAQTGALSDTLLQYLTGKEKDPLRDPAELFLRGSSINGRMNVAHLLDTGISSFSLTLSEAVDWTAFGIWLTWLLHRHGASVLRIKGLLKVTQCEGPVVFHAVQHMVYPPEHLERWPDAEQTSQLVFIVKDLDAALIERSLRAFNNLTKVDASYMQEWSRHKNIGAGSTVRGRPVRRPSTPRWIR